MGFGEVGLFQSNETFKLHSVNSSQILMYTFNFMLMNSFLIFKADLLRNIWIIISYKNWLLVLGIWIITLLEQRNLRMILRNRWFWRVYPFRLLYWFNLIDKLSQTASFISEKNPFGRRSCSMFKQSITKRSKTWSGFYLLWWFS